MGNAATDSARTRFGGRVLIRVRHPEDRGYLVAIGERILREHPIPPDRKARPSGGGLWLIHHGRRADILGVELPPDRRLCVKFLHDNRPSVWLRTLIGLGRARAAYRRGLRLERVGIHGPRALGFLERQPFGPSAFFMELLDHHETVRNRLRRLQTGAGLHGPEIRAIARSLGRYVGHLHRRGISHKDLTTKNLLLPTDTTRLDCALIDFEDLRFPLLGVGTRSRHRTLWKLGRSAKDLPAREQLRFLRHYLLAIGEPPRAAPFARELLRRWGHTMRE